MWSILRAAMTHVEETVRTRRSAEFEPARDAHAAANGKAAGNGAAPTLNGAPATTPLVNRAASETSGDPAAVEIYLHPGRTPLGTMDGTRAAAQFDLRLSRVFFSFDEAESACEGLRGFLIRERASATGEPSIHFVEHLRA